MGAVVRAQALAIVLLGWALAGCTTSTPGTATSPPGDRPPPETSQASETLPANGAPKVATPLDTAKFQQEPCLSLTAAQSQELNLGAGGSLLETAVGPGCEWDNPDTGGAVDIIFPVKNPVGLSGAYGAEKRGTVEVFIELPPIEGYPAVVRNAEDRRHLGTCTVLVGTSDEMAVNVVLRLSRDNVGKKDPCELSAQVAGMAIRTIERG